MSTFSFDVAFSSHDLLKAGVTEAGWHRVVVDARDRDEAALIACQMVCTHDTATAVYDRI